MYLNGLTPLRSLQVFRYCRARKWVNPKDTMPLSGLTPLKLLQSLWYHHTRKLIIAKDTTHLTGTTPFWSLQVLRYHHTREWLYRQGRNTPQWRHASSIVTGLPILAYKMIVCRWGIQCISPEQCHSYRNMAFDTTIQENEVTTKDAIHFNGSTLLCSLQILRYQCTK